MIQIQPPRPEAYSKIVIQVFSAAYGGWCDYRDQADGEQGVESIRTLETIKPGFRFRLVRRYVNDVPLDN